MQIGFLRVSREMCEIAVRRDDGVVLRGHQRARGGGPPHDLVHLAVEGALELSDGFWACVAAGAEFRSLDRTAGRRPPHARDRSRTVLRGARRQLTTAEVLAGAVERLAASRLDRDPARLLHAVQHRLSNCEAPRPAIDAERLCRACAILREYDRRWRRLPVGHELVAEWPLKSPAPGRRRGA